jgi:hypothetical protein
MAVPASNSCSLTNHFHYCLRQKNRIKVNHHGRSKQAFATTPSEIKPLVSPWIKESKQIFSNKLITNIPIEYLSFAVHARSNSIKVLKTFDYQTECEIEFKPAYFESNDRHDFRLLDLFKVQMNPENKVSTSFEGLNKTWICHITSLPWRHNELMALMSIYQMVETAFEFPNEAKCTLADLVKICSRKQLKREYVRSLYSLLVIQDSDLLLVDNENEILCPISKLFHIKSNVENYQSLAKELRNISESNYENLMAVLENFIVDFSSGALFELERRHEHKTKEKPDNYIYRRGGTKPSYKQKRFKGGHLFHMPHPNLDIENHVLRSWMLLSAYQPQAYHEFNDVRKVFDYDSFLAITGLENTQKKKPERMQKYIQDISKYWGSLEMHNNSIIIKYGLDNELEKLFETNTEISPIDLNYGWLSDSEDTSKLSRKLYKLNELKELYRSTEDDNRTPLICATKHLTMLKEEKFTGKELTNSTQSSHNKQPPKGGEKPFANLQKGENEIFSNLQKGEKSPSPTSKRGRMDLQKGEKDSELSSVKDNNFFLETERNTNKETVSLSRNRPFQIGNENQKTKRDDSFKSILKDKVKNLGQIIPEDTRTKLLSEIDKATSLTNISMYIEKVEKKIQISF